MKAITMCLALTVTLAGATTSGRGWGQTPPSDSVPPQPDVPLVPRLVLPPISATVDVPLIATLACGGWVPWGHLTAWVKQGKFGNVIALACAGAEFDFLEELGYSLTLIDKGARLGDYLSTEAPIELQTEFSLGAQRANSDLQSFAALSEALSVDPIGVVTEAANSPDFRKRYQACVELRRRLLDIEDQALFLNLLGGLCPNLTAPAWKELCRLLQVSRASGLAPSVQLVAYVTQRRPGWCSMLVCCHQSSLESTISWLDEVIASNEGLPSGAGTAVPIAIELKTQLQQLLPE